VTANVKAITVWKKNATVAERLYELARWAEENPDQIDRFVLLYQGARSKEGSCDLGRTELGFAFTNEVISLLEVAKAYYLQELMS